MYHQIKTRFLFVVDVIKNLNVIFDSLTISVQLISFFLFKRDEKLFSLRFFIAQQIFTAVEKRVDRQILLTVVDDIYASQHINETTC